VDVIKKGTGDFVVQDQPLTDDVDYIEYIPCKYYCAHFTETSQWKHSFVLTPECTESGKPGNEWARVGKARFQFVAVQKIILAFSVTE